MYVRSTRHSEQLQMVAGNQGLTDDDGDTKLLILKELTVVEWKMSGK